MENRNPTGVQSGRRFTENLPKKKWMGFCLDISLVQEAII